MKLDLTLYLVTDRGNMGTGTFLNKVERALRAGVTLLQLREKELEGRAFYELAGQVNEIARACGVPLLIDDRVDIAMAVGAAGVHVGQGDIPVDAARQLLGPDRIVGATAKTVEQARQAQRQGADYVGVGAIYPTTTKVKTVLTSTETLAAICSEAEIPAVAIGGLNSGNLGVLRGCGMQGIAVVSALMKRDDVEQAVRELRDAVDPLIG